MTPTTPKKRVLIVSFLFPPTNSVGAVRVGKFTKYLPRFGWEPVALTADTLKERLQGLPVEMDEKNVFRTPYFALYSSLSRNLQVNQGITSEDTSLRFNWKKPIYKAVRLAQPIYNLSILAPLLRDPIGWYPHATRKGSELLNKYGIDVIFSSYAPSTSHLVARRLHQISGVPWVAEFRDLWALNHNARTTRFLQYLTCRLERRVMKHSSLLISTSEPWAKQLEALHSKKAIIIPNGFDEDDYVEDIPLTSKFTITYTGQIYARKQDPTPLFKVLKQLEEEGKISSSDFEVRFFGGNLLETTEPLVERYGIRELVKVYGLVPFSESVRRQKESSVLLILKWNDPKEKGVYTGKLYEYLGAKRPILAVGSFNENVDDLISESGTGISVDEPHLIKEILSHWLDEWQKSGRIVSHWQPRADVIQRYTRKAQAGKLAQLLDEVSS
jgi:hypothetical protein